MKALIVVDMQNDFCTGSLAVPGALDIVGGISELIASDAYRVVVFTRCWHPPNHCSFKENGGTWPTHCVEFTKGAQLQPALAGLQLSTHSVVINKGRKHDVEEYSGFAVEYMRDALNSTFKVDICGVARQYCVESTYQDAIKAGFKATVLEHLCRSVPA